MENKLSQDCEEQLEKKRLRESKDTFPHFFSVQENMAHLNQSKFGILKRDSCCPFEVLMLNRMEPITTLTSNQYSL